VLVSITGNVTEDVDNDNKGDVGLAGVTVTLLDSTGTTIAITTTDSRGYYVFNNLPKGVYTMMQTNLVKYLDVSDV
jgi:hypothetical protein